MLTIKLRFSISNLAKHVHSMCILGRRKNHRFVDPNIIGASRLVHSDLRIYRISLFLLDRTIFLHLEIGICSNSHLKVDENESTYLGTRGLSKLCLLVGLRPPQVTRLCYLPRTHTSTCAMTRGVNMPGDPYRVPTPALTPPPGPRAHLPGCRW